MSNEEFVSDIRSHRFVSNICTRCGIGASSKALINCKEQQKINNTHEWEIIEEEGGEKFWACKKCGICGCDVEGGVPLADSYSNNRSLTCKEILMKKALL